MTKNQYKFILLTGKYLPDEDIKYNGDGYYFEHLDSNSNRIYYENSNGEWKKFKYNNKGRCYYREDSTGYQIYSPTQNR